MCTPGLCANFSHTPLMHLLSNLLYLSQNKKCTTSVNIVHMRPLDCKVWNANKYNESYFVLIDRIWRNVTVHLWSEYETDYNGIIVDKIKHSVGHWFHYTFIQNNARHWRPQRESVCLKQTSIDKVYNVFSTSITGYAENGGRNVPYLSKCPATMSCMFFFIASFLFEGILYIYEACAILFYVKNCWPWVLLWPVIHCRRERAVQMRFIAKMPTCAYEPLSAVALYSSFLYLLSLLFCPALTAQTHAYCNLCLESVNHDRES